MTITPGMRFRDNDRDGTRELIVAGKSGMVGNNWWLRDPETHVLVCSVRETELHTDGKLRRSGWSLVPEPAQERAGGVAGTSDPSVEPDAAQPPPRGVRGGNGHDDQRSKPLAPM